MTRTLCPVAAVAPKSTDIEQTTGTRGVRCPSSYDEKIAEKHHTDPYYYEKQVVQWYPASTIQHVVVPVEQMYISLHHKP